MACCTSGTNPTYTCENKAYKGGFMSDEKLVFANGVLLMVE